MGPPLAVQGGVLLAIWYPAAYLVCTLSRPGTTLQFYEQLCLCGWSFKVLNAKTSQKFPT